MEIIAFTVETKRTRIFETYTYRWRPKSL